MRVGEIYGRVRVEKAESVACAIQRTLQRGERACAAPHVFERVDPHFQKIIN